MKKTLTLLALLAAATLATAQTAAPDGFRGPKHDGRYPAETGLMKTWPAEGPAKLWENLEIGKGYSSPTVIGDKVYLTGMTEDEKTETFMALDQKTGKILYTTPYSPAWNQAYPETRTTPTIYKGKAYVVSGSGEVVCMDIADGKIVWKVNGATFGTETGRWGTAECPLVFDDKVIYTPGGNQTLIVALDAATGKEIWRSDSKGVKRSYVTPILVEWNGKHQIIGSGEGLLFGADPTNGKIQWTFAFPSSNNFENICPNSPLFKDGKVFFSQGYDANSYLLQLNPDMTEVTQVWNNTDLDTHHGGYVLVDGIIYGTNWVNNNSGNWLAVDWETGETLYNKAWEGGKGKGSIIYSDGLLYCYDERRGFIGIVAPDGKDFKTISEFRMDKGDGPFWAHLVIADGVLYARHGGALIAYKIK